MRNLSITVIGAGHMGSAIIGGLIAAGYKPSSLCATNPSITQLQSLQDQFKIRVTQSNVAGASAAKILILAVKPQLLHQVITELTPVIAQNKPLIISIAAGISEHTIRKQLGIDLPIVRAMPNTPVLIRNGATALYANAYVSAEQRQLAQSIFDAVGWTVWIEDEQYMYTITALSGSGPAYFFLLIQALEEAATQLGLSEDIAKGLIIQTALGSVRMALDQDAVALRQQVTSPGGGTERAIHTLESHHFRHLLFEAVQAAEQRYKALGELK